MTGYNGALDVLWLATWTGSLAILAVLLLRAPVRRHFGAGCAYALWWLPVATWVALWLPARIVEVSPSTASPAATQAAVWVTAAASAPSFDIGLLWLPLWGLGAAVMVGMLLRQQRRFERGLGRMQPLAGEYRAWQAECAEGLPAVIGLLRPRIILPADIDTRFDDQQRQLMLAHERIHLRRGDAWANAGAALARCIFWFNPLVHIAAMRMRHDQELACDAGVVATYPHARRAYGEAMLKNATSTSTLVVPLGCHWGITHPMKERIMSLKNAVPSRGARVAGAMLVGATALVVAAAAWAALPPRQVERSSEVDVRSEGRDYQAQIGISVDGSAANDITLVGGYGKPFKVRVNDSDAGAYDLEGTVTEAPSQDGSPAYRLQAQLRRDGELMGDPVLLLGAGRPARIKLGEEVASGRFSGIEMDVRIGDIDAVTAELLDDANVARADAAHSMVMAKRMQDDAAMAAADARRTAADAAQAADEASLMAADAAQAARVASKEAARAAAEQREAVRIERRVIRTQGSAMPAPPAPPTPPAPPSSPRMGSVPPPAAPLAPPPASMSGNVHIERRVRDGTASAGASRSVNIASHAQAIAAGGRALTLEQADALGLGSQYRWVDLQVLFNDKGVGSLELRSDAIVTVKEKQQDTPRYAGYLR